MLLYTIQGYNKYTALNPLWPKASIKKQLGPLIFFTVVSSAQLSQVTSEEAYSTPLAANQGTTPVFIPLITKVTLLKSLKSSSSNSLSAQGR